MNIQDAIGPVDAYSAVVVLGIGASITIMSCVAMARKRSTELRNDFELAKMRLSYEHQRADHQIAAGHERDLASLASTREIEFKRIDSGMIDLKANRGGSGGD